MLYNKTISIYKKGNMRADENGIPVYPWELVTTIKADVQPITNAKVKKTYGEYDNVQYRVYVNEVIEGLNTSDYKVKYKSNEYIIKNVMAFEDILPYMELLIGDRNEN